MIPLSPIKVEQLHCSRVKITDTTNYDTEISSYPFSAFENGTRIIRITYPDGSVKLFSERDDTNSQLLTPFAGEPTIQNPDPIEINIEYLDTTITAGNNTTANWEFDLESGDYRVDIISIPDVRAGFPFSYSSGAFFCTLDDDGRTVLLFNIKINNISGYYVYVNLNTDLTTVTMYGTPYPGGGGAVVDVNSSNINTVYFSVDCNIEDNISCIFSNYYNSFCKSCGCDCICKDKKAGNILKATMLLRELELLEDNATEYQKRLELYTPILNTLCHCS